MIEVPENKIKQLNKTGFRRAFLKVIRDMGVCEITCDELESLPKDETVGCTYDVEGDKFIFSVVRVEKRPILTPSRKVIA